jgi:formamidopyrimidine-DNA glycosylase
VFELPEYLTLARQINESLVGKIIREGIRGNSPHKFVWYNRTAEEFAALSRGKRIGKAHVKGRWLIIALESDYFLVVGEWGGRFLFHPPGSEAPKKFHLYLAFEDGSTLSATTQMWGAVELYEAGLEHSGKYVRDQKPSPIDPQFTFDYFSALIDTVLKSEKKSVKGILTQDQLIPGLGNAIAQDIMFNARLHPKHRIDDLDQCKRQELYRSIQETVSKVIEQGGRYDEYDLYNRPGGYVRLMDSKSAGKTCPVCSEKISKIQYLGGACYFCPQCQQ